MLGELNRENWASRWRAGCNGQYIDLKLEDVWDMSDAEVREIDPSNHSKVTEKTFVAFSGFGRQYAGAGNVQSFNDYSGGRLSNGRTRGAYGTNPRTHGFTEGGFLAHRKYPAFLQNDLYLGDYYSMLEEQYGDLDDVELEPVGKRKSRHQNIDIHFVNILHNLQECLDNLEQSVEDADAQAAFDNLSNMFGYAFDAMAELNYEEGMLEVLMDGMLEHYSVTELVGLAKKHTARK